MSYLQPEDEEDFVPMSEPVSFENVRCEKETDKALLCCIEGEDCWVPKSMVDEDSEVYEEGHDGTLIVNSWWAEKAGLL